jgi:chromate transporter
MPAGGHLVAKTHSFAVTGPVWTSSVRTLGDFGIALVGFVPLAAWRAPPLLVVIISALGGILLANIS